MIRKRETAAFRDQQADAIDRNPRIDCNTCGESISWNDWQEIITGEITPETEFVCPDCQQYERDQYQIEAYKRLHKQLTEWSE